METLHTLVHTAMQSTPQGFLGVGLIFFYMCVIVGTAVYRICENLHDEHH